jgi:hypothetical protein
MWFRLVVSSCSLALASSAAIAQQSTDLADTEKTFDVRATLAFEQPAESPPSFALEAFDPDTPDLDNPDAGDLDPFAVETLALDALARDAGASEGVARDGVVPEVFDAAAHIDAILGFDDDAAHPLTDPSDLTDLTDLTDRSLMRNEDVLAMVDAAFSETLIKATMEANATAFDVSPRALVALKSAGVPETVIEAMLVNESARRHEAVVPTAGPTAITTTTEAAAAAATEIATLTATAAAGPAGDAEATAGASSTGTAMLALTAPANVLETASNAPSPETAVGVVAVLDPAPTTNAPQRPSRPSGPGPHAWRAGADAVLTPTTAQVAFVETRGSGSAALKTLDSLGGRKALVFASPALAVANEIRGLFRSGDPMTMAVWALPGVSSDQALTADAVIEVEFDNIPGVNADRYRPAVVRLVPTVDNYRLVGAAKTKLSDLDAGVPTEPIVEEPVAADFVALDRGHYRVTLPADLAAGEYALVLRPVEPRQKRRDAPTSLGGLLGGSAANLLYVTWEFSVAAETAVH